MQAWARARQAAGERIACVPTMGCLHAGHISLVARARAAAERVVLTLFVNPTQFGPGEDFAAYPRDVAHDRDCCEAAGVDVLFLPAAAAIAAEREFLSPGDKTAFLGIGSGLNTIMLGVDW